MLNVYCAWEPHVNQDSHTECCTLTVHGIHTLIKICSNLTQVLIENYQKSTWKSLHVSGNIVYNKICHKHIHIMAWKDQKEKK